MAAAAGVAYPDADWSEAWISSSDGVTLHADVLRPKGATDATKTPVIISIGPYFNHSGQTGPAGPAEGTKYDPVGPNAGPSERFQDFVEGSGLLKKGYSFVMVDLRGFGGSNGCLDWSGPGEKADVVHAVQWAASRPWSNGRVGMYGKSYDGLTGLIGVDLRPAGLAAVVSQEPVYDDYRYLYGDGMRRLNSVATPALYDGIAATPGPLTDTPNYNVNSLNNPVCLASNFGAQAANDDHGSEFWKQRNLIPGAAGSKVPLLLTQGLTENNTVADGLQQYLDNHTGYERAWLGPWDHVRGNETDPDTGKLKMGRAGWFAEVMRFYDRFLKGSRADGRRPAGRRADERRQVALGGQVAAGRPPRLHDRPSRRQLHRQRPVLLDRRRRRLDRELRRLDDLQAAALRPAPRGLGHDGGRTSRRPCRTPIWRSTCTTSTPTAPAR